MSLESDVLGPLDESGQVLLGGEITTWLLGMFIWPKRKDIPIPKVLDFFSKRGFWGVLATFLVPSEWSVDGPDQMLLAEIHIQGADAGFDFPFAALGCGSLSQRCIPSVLNRLEWHHALTLCCQSC